jgi:raffinose/stachyose/melibiose transport system permease protein
MSVQVERFKSAPLWQRTFVRLVVMGVMILIGLVILYPLLIILFTAFKSDAELVRNPVGVPAQLYFDNFRLAWTDARMSNLMFNSVFISVCVVTGSVLLASMGGFALARLDFPGRAGMPILLTMGLVLPIETLMIPLFYSFKPLGLLNTYWAILLPQIALGLPFGILMLRGFIHDLPQELFDSAELDGSGLWEQYFYFVLPLTRPALIALAVFQFLWSWNQYLLPLVMTQNPDMQTIPLGLSYFVGRYQSSFGGLAAAAVIALLPMFLFYVIFHRQILQANLAGAFK